MSYLVVALVNPKTPENIGGVMRAAHCFNASLVVLGGPRPQQLSKLRTDTVRAWRHTPHILTDDVLSVLPYDCTPIAIDILPDARPLQNFTHPKRGFYIFGAEDTTLGEDIAKRCTHRIFVPTRNCMNLASAVCVVLYDRLLKSG